MNEEQLRADLYAEIWDWFWNRGEESVETQCKRLVDQQMKHIHYHIRQHQAQPPTDAEVERVARAIYGNNPATSNGKAMSWEDCTEIFPGRISECWDDARTAIAALREGE